MTTENKKVKQEKQVIGGKKKKIKSIVQEGKKLKSF